MKVVIALDPIGVHLDYYVSDGNSAFFASVPCSTKRTIRPSVCPNSVPISSGNSIGFDTMPR
ncbi:MAG: hypothetical protein JRN20_09900 [Nitrososphaerota archaeon]|nr:hypothetical protein [Nitrososphaerota archaeon]